MPPKKSAASSKASTATPNPRGRGPKKPFKSTELIDDEAEVDASDKSMKDVNITSRARGRPRSVSRAKSVVASSDDEDRMSVVSVNIVNSSRPVSRSGAAGKRAKDESIDISSGDDAMSVASSAKLGLAKGKGKAKGKANVKEDISGSVDISSGDDKAGIRDNRSTNVRGRARSVSRSSVAKSKDDNDWFDESSDDARSIKSAKSAKSAMSVDDEEWVATPPRRSRSIVPKTPVSSRTSSVNRKRSASLMVSPITDEESFDMLPSPTKSVRFQKETPLRGVLKKTDFKPEVVIPVFSSKASNPVPDDWDSEDAFSSAAVSSSLARKGSVFKNKDDGEDRALLSPFEFEGDADKTPKKVSGPPDKDETDIGNRDPALKSSYKGLPKLKAACMLSWSSKAAVIPSYSGMLEEVPGVNKRLLYEALTFSGLANFRNLSRTDPAKVSTAVGSQTYFHAVGGGGPLLFLSAVRVGECRLFEPRTSSNGKTQKILEGALIEGEWERLVGAVGHIIDKVEYRAQIQAGYLSFSTAFASGTSSVSSPLGLRRPSGPNPFTRGPISASVALSCHDIVPVYDARGENEASFYEILPDLEKLPRINRELPSGSCAVVAYTVNTWGQSLPVNVSFNIKWAMLLGVPGKGRTR